MTAEWIAIEGVETKFVPADETLDDGWREATPEEIRRLRRGLRRRRRIRVWLRLWWLARRGRPEVEVIKDVTRYIPVWS